MECIKEQILLEANQPGKGKAGKHANRIQEQIEKLKEEIDRLKGEIKTN